MYEALDDLEPLGELLLDLLGLRRAHLLLQFGHGGLHVGLGERIADRFSTHLGDERVITVFGEGLTIFGIGEELLHLERGLARIDDHEVLVVDDALERTSGHIQQETEPARHALQKPDVGNRDRELDVPHALATDAGDRDLDATAIAHDVLVFDALVFSARALVVTHGPKDLLAEKTAWLGLKGAVVDRLGILNLTLGPFANGLGGSDGDGDAVECVLLDAECGTNVVAGRGGCISGLNHGDVSLSKMS